MRLMVSVETQAGCLALHMGGAYRSSGFADGSILFVGDHLNLPLSLLSLIPICLQLSGLLNCSRGLLVISSLDGTWGNSGYEGERVFARREVCTDNMGAGVLLVTARSRVV